MALLDLLGRRWSLRVIWELREGALTSRELRTACDEVSPTVLQTRLNELRAAGLVEHQTGEGYRLTNLGNEFLHAFTPLNAFAQHWAERSPPIRPPSSG